MQIYQVTIVVGETRDLYILANSLDEAQTAALEMDTEHLDGMGECNRAILDAALYTDTNGTQDTTPVLLNHCRGESWNS